MDRRFVLVQIFNERLDAAFIVEVVFFTVALVAQTNGNAGVEERQLTQTFRQNFIFELGHIGEGFEAWPETHHGAGFFSLAGNRQRSLRYTVFVDLTVNFTLALDNQLQFFATGRLLPKHQRRADRRTLYRSYRQIYRLRRTVMITSAADTPSSG